MRKILMLAVAAIITSGMVACGKKNDSVATTPVDLAGGCPPGHYNNGQGCIVAPGGSAYYNLGGGIIRLGGSISAIGSQAFAQLLGQYGGFCMNNGWNNWPGQFNYNIAIGSYNCRQYAQAGYVKIIFDPSAARAQVVLGAGTQNGRSLHEVIFNSRVFPINNNAGMEIRGNGNAYSGGWNAVYDQGLVIRVQQGTPLSTQMTAELEYRGQRVGTAEIYRY